MSNWYAYLVPPQKEFIAGEILSRQGLEVIIPTETKLRRKNRYSKKKEPVTYAMLIGYIFVEIPEKVPWWAPCRFPVVRSVVGIDGQPTAIPFAEIGRLNALGYVPHKNSRNTRAGLLEGEEVIIAGGPLQGWLGRIEEVKGQKARMFFEMLGSTREIEIDLENLEAA